MSHRQNAASPALNPIEHAVRSDKLELLFQQSFPAVFVAIVIAALMAWLVRNQANPAILLGWLSTVGVCALARLALFLRYFHMRPSGSQLRRWELTYLYSLLFTSSVWGVGATLVMATVPVLEQVICLFIVMGMAGGAVSSYSAYRTMSTLSMLSLLVPPVLWLLWLGDELHIGLAVGVAVFMVVSLRTIRVVATALHRSFQLSREMTRAHDMAEILARTDMLTGINNRRAFFERSQQIIQYCKRNQRPVCLLAMDVDHFKKINDTYGHAGGDEALKSVSDILCRQFRKADVCGRIGGEEFAVLLPDTQLIDAQVIAETLRSAIADAPLLLQGRKLSLTISVGVAAGTYDLDTLLSRADAAMYRAKQEGRNQVMTSMA